MRFEKMKKLGRVVNETFRGAAPATRGRRSATPAAYAAEALERRRLFSLTVPAYSSLPSAPKTIFLDFDGNGAFTLDGGDGKRVHGPNGDNSPIPAFNIDSDPNNFSSQELSEIGQIWQWVAEKYSPINVNVTTVDPGNRTHGVMEQCLIGGSVNDWLKQANVSGISDVNGFANPNLSNTAFVFSADGASDPQNVQVKQIGDEAAHEVGHSMGLVHQRSSSTVFPASEYYPGDSTRVPIMGGSNGNFSGKGIWWKTNNWPGQNSPDAYQDDLDIMTSPIGGPLSYRVDDVTNPATLTLTSDGTYAPAYGVIERSADTDIYKFSPPTSAVSFTVKNATLGGMLTPHVYIYDINAGTTVSAVTYANTANQATVSASSLTPGRSYEVVVGGSGQYGDIGQYSLNGTVTQFATYNATSKSLTISGQPGANNLVVSVEYNGAGNPGLLQISDAVNGGNPGIQTYPINSVQNIYIELSGANNKIKVQPLYPLYNNGEFGGPDVTVNGGGNDSLTIDMVDSTGSFTVGTAGIYRLVHFVSTDVYLDGGFNNVTLRGGTEQANVYTVHNWDNSIRLTLDGTFGNTNQFNFYGDDFQGSNPDIIVIGGNNGADTVNINASVLGGPLNGSITNSNINLGNSGTVLAGLIVSYSNIEAINITATGGADSLNVYSLPAATTLSYYGGDGDDTVRLGYSAGSINVDSILGNVYFYGGAGSNTGILDDAYNAFGRTYVVDHTHIGTTTGGNLFNGGGVTNFTINGGSMGSTYSVFQGQPGVSLILNGGAGNDSFNFDNATTWNAIVYGNGGLNNLTVDDTAGSSAPYRTDIRDQSLTHFYGTASSPTSYAIGYNNIGSATYDGAPTTNQLNVFSTSSDIAAGYQWVAVMNTGNDTINIYPHNTATGGANLLGGIGIIGGGGTDTVNFDDSVTPIGVTYRFYNPYGSSTADIAGLGGALVGVANDVENIAVLGSPMNDEFEVDSFQSGSAVTLNGNGGNDTCDITPVSKDISANITTNSPLTFIGGAGTDALNVYNNNSTVAWSYSQTVASVASVKSGYSLTIPNSGVEAYSISAGSGADGFLIGSPAGSVTTVAGGGGLNLVTTLSGGNVLFAASQTLSSLTVAANSTVAMAANGGLVLRTNSMSIGSGAKLDLSNDTLIDDYTGGSPAATVRNLLIAGRNGGAWNGASGIVSSAVAGKAGSTLGDGEASTIVGPSGGTFAGQTVDGTTLIVRYTLAGDSNLNRTVDFNDFLALQNGFNQIGRGFAGGDFDYSGTTDFNDFLSLQNNFNQTVSGTPAQTTTGPTTPVVTPPTPPADKKTASLSGVAFNDANKNGKYDKGDTLAAGKTVWLDLNDDGVKDANEPSTVTDAQGRYTFKNLAAGTYHVRRVFAAGYVESTAARYITLAAGQAASSVYLGSKLK